MPGYTEYTDLVVTTLEKRQKKLTDNLLDNNVLLQWLKRRSNVKVQDGGRVIVEELMYPGGSNFKRYSGYELLDTTPIQFFNAAEYPWAQAAVTVSASGLELRSNMGESRMIPLLKSRIEAAEKDMINNISGDVYSDGSADGGKQIDGLDIKIETTGSSSTSTVGGIDRTNEDWWQNYASADIGDFSATTIKGYMQTAWLNLVRGNDHPKLIVADANLFGFFWDAMLDIQRINQPDTGISGFESLQFRGPGGSAPVFFDSSTPTNRMYFLNTDYLFWKPHRDANFTAMPEVKSTNQDAIVVPIIFQGNMTMSNASLQGVIWT